EQLDGAQSKHERRCPPCMLQCGGQPGSDGQPGPPTDLLCLYVPPPETWETMLPRSGAARPSPQCSCGGEEDAFTDLVPIVRRQALAASAPAAGGPETPAKTKVQTTEWLFKPRDGRAVVVFAAPRFGAPLTGHTLKPGERFRAAEVQESGEEGGLRFLRLADHRGGWVVDREPGHEMCYRLSDGLDELWMYAPANGKPMGIRGEPHVWGARTGGSLSPGQTFRVSEIRAGDSGVLFLRLSDGQGWVFDEKFSAPFDGELGSPRGYSALLSPRRGVKAELVWAEAPDGVLCKRVLDETWICQPARRRPVPILESPHIGAEKTGYKMHPQETFKVVEIEAGAGADASVLFLRLADGRGWLFDEHPDLGRMCSRVRNIATRTTLLTEAANKISVQSIKDFRIGGIVEIVSASGTERGTIKDIQEFKREITLSRALVHVHPAGSSVTAQHAKPARWF
ncbi:unnamed protein product, partial [Prorocentrum cordatum]